MAGAIAGLDMKKFWKIIGSIFLVVFILLVVALIGGYIFLKQFDIAKYKPQVINMAIQALGRPVDFKDINLKVSLFEGIRFSLSDFSIGENPDFGNETFVSVGKVEAGVNILPFILARQVSVPNILILSPRINIIRDARGVLNAHTLGQSPQGAPSKGQGATANAAALPALLINSFIVKNAEVCFIDKSVQPEQKLAVTQLNLGVRNFSLMNPFDVSVDGAVLSAQTDVRVSGKIQLKLSKNEVKLTDIEASVDLNQLSLDELKAFPFFKGVPIPQVLKGQLKALIKEAVVSDKGVEDCILNISLSGGQIVAADIVPGISLEARNLDFSLDNFSLGGSRPFRVNLTAALYQEQRNVTFKSDVFLDLKTMGISLANGQFSTDLSLWPLGKIKTAVAALKDIPLPERLAGKLETEIRDLKVYSAGLQSILIDAKLSGGEIDLKNIIPGVILALNKIDLAVKDFSLTRPFSVSLKTACLSESQDIAFEGNVEYDLNTRVTAVKDAVVNFDLDGFCLGCFKSSGLVPAGVPFPQSLGGKLEARIDNLTASANGVEQMNADIGWLNGKISIPEAAPGISVTANAINVNVKNFSLKGPFDVTASLGYESDVPNISFNGEVAFDPAAQSVHLSQVDIKTDLSRIPFERLKTTIAPLKTVPLPEVLKGQLHVLVNELSTDPQGLKAVTVDVALKDGEVSMKEAAPGVSFAASGIKADIKNFGLGTPFGFNIELAYLHDKPNIKAKGSAILRIEEQSVTIKDAAVETDLSTFALDQLKSSFAALKNASLPEKVEGKFTMAIAEAVAGAKGLSHVTSQGSIKGGRVKLKELALPIQGLDTNFRVADKDFSMDTIQASLGKGQIIAQLGVKDYPGFQNFTLSAEIKGIDLSEILDQKQSPVKVEGLVFGTFKAAGQGADINSITGDGNFEVKEAKLKDFNALKVLLDKISFLPNVSTRVEASLSDKYKEKLNNKDTKIKKISAVCAVSKSTVMIDPVSIEADEFIFSGKSQAGFDQKYSLDGAFKIPAELSAAMAEGVSEMQYLFDENKNISLPVHVTGQGGQKPVVSVTQTALDMGRNVLRNEGKKELEKVLNKVLGAGQKSAPPDAQQQQPEGVPQDQTSPASEIIDSIFKKVFK
jgi:hypothetical protein